MVEKSPVSGLGNSSIETVSVNWSSAATAVDELDSHNICYDATNKRIFMYGYEKRLFIYDIIFLALFSLMLDYHP